MELKEFIKETISGILDATLDLQEAYEETGIFLNPPVSVKERDLFEENAPGSTYRRVETVEFDVAVTAASDSSGGGRAGLRIMSIEAGASGEHRRSNEQVSRVKFSIPITLPKSLAEGVNKEALEQQRTKIKSALGTRRATGRF